MLRVCVYTVFVSPCCFLVYSFMMWETFNESRPPLGLTGLFTAWAHPEFLSQRTVSVAACVYGIELVEMYVNVAVVSLHIWHEWWSLFKMYVNVVLVSCLYLAMSYRVALYKNALLLLLFMEFLQVEEHTTSRNDL